METITSGSNRYWIESHPLKLDRYLRRSHKRQDREYVKKLILQDSPDEGKKLIENFHLSGAEKKLLLVQWLLYQPQITCGIFADQRMGKDALICKIFEDVTEYCLTFGFSVPRFVTLGNLRCPPFVNEKDMYFSFKNIPSGTKQQEVWIYCSEIETVLPSREGSSAENRLFSQLEGTMAQNHQKLFGACKLASKVDLNFIRGMNCKLFKYISLEKLGIEGVERVNILSPLARWLLPQDKEDKSQTLMAFDNQLLTVKYFLPTWWSSDYSEQYRDIDDSKVWEYVDTMLTNGMDSSSISIAVAQKFRKNFTKRMIDDYQDKNE